MRVPSRVVRFIAMTMMDRKDNGVLIFIIQIKYINFLNCRKPGTNLGVGAFKELDADPESVLPPTLIWDDVILQHDDNTII